MDKVKVFLAQLKKHHFWVLTGIVLIMSLTGWYLAASALSEEYTQNRNKIKSKFDDLNKIVSVVNHPNPTFEQGTKQLTRVLKKDVEQAWNLVYSDQHDNVLKWPEKLGDDFLEIIEALEPTDEIPVELRERYLNYVKEEFPRLLKIIDARPYWDKTEDEGGGPGGRNRKPVGAVAKRRQNMAVDENREYRTIWERKNQEEIDATLDWSRTPTTQEVRFCQENLWVYHAVLDAIAKVNEGSTGHHNAKIKEVIQLSIGKEAATGLLEALAQGRILSGDAATGQAGAPGSPMGGGAMMPQGMPMGGEGTMMPPGAEGGPGGAAAAAKSLEDKRYVDEKGVPMAAGAAGPPEFKRMPVMIRLLMDQREISTLLVQLANSKLPVEIRQLRLNPKVKGFTQEKEIQFGGGGDGDSSALRKGPKITQNTHRAQDELTQYPYDMPVEMHGFIFIFNRPDKKVFVDEAIAEGDATAVPEAAAVPTDAAPPAEQAPPAQPADAEGDVEKAPPKKAAADDAEAEPAEPEAAPPKKKAVVKPADEAAPEDESAPEATKDTAEEPADPAKDKPEKEAAPE